MSRLSTRPNAIIMSIRHPEWQIITKIEKHLGKDLCISSITYAELVYGIKKATIHKKADWRSRKYYMG